MPTGWWIGDFLQSGQTAMLFAWIFWVIVSICLHELGHGVAALWQGDDTPRRYGHMTLNPMVHMGGWSLLCFVLIGFAWGMMPVDPSRFRWKRRGRIVVAGAGPAVNLILAALLIPAAGLYLAWTNVETLSDLTAQQRNIHQFLFTGGWLNLALCLFNLLPIPPLDGSQMLAGTTNSMYRLFTSPQAAAYGQFILIAVLFSGVAGVIFGAANAWARSAMFGVTNLAHQHIFTGSS
ncbi:MAG: site-2 protease family protein [Phycisphaerae bacterium]|nr:site-2 protease family protein [Phycisphaerae bacterium]